MDAEQKTRTVTEAMLLCTKPVRGASMKDKSPCAKIGCPHWKEQVCVYSGHVSAPDAHEGCPYQHDKPPKE